MKKRELSIILIVIFSAAIYCNAQIPFSYNVERMAFNSSFFNEMSPVIGKDGGIMFCSDRRLSAITNVTSFDGRRLFNIFQIAGSDTSSSAVMELKSERAMKFNSGPFCISADGRVIYFTSEVETEKKNVQDKNFVNRNGIFIAQLSGNEILNVKPFRYNSLEYDVGQPSLSADGNTLYFASNKPGGYGGSDIYYCELVNGEWAEPVNLGEEINTSASESYPFIHSSGRLYFSSDREGGIGQLDIYSTQKVNGKWEKPTLLPEPINSPADDFAFTIEPNRQIGYFTSNRASNDNIYSFKSYVNRMAICDTLQENSYCYRFTEENAVKTDTIPFRYIWRFGDGATATGAIVEHCYEKTGTYTVQLDVVNLITNEVMYNEKSETLIITDIEQPFITSPDAATAGAVIKIDADKTYLPDWNIDQYFWHFDDETTHVGKEADKVYTNPGTYNIQLIVSGKTSAGELQERCVCKNIIISDGR